MQFLRCVSQLKRSHCLRSSKFRNRSICKQELAQKNKSMRILVTGTEGYIGSVLAPLLMQRGHEVIGLDTGFYKVGWLYNATELSAKTLNKDLRHITEKDLQGV